MIGPEEVLGFWLDEVGPEGWYKVDEALDEQVREKFEEAWNRAMLGGYSLWLTHASGTLAYIILMDQLSRNMFRAAGKAFASDKAALAAAKSAISKGWDMRIDEPARIFFYMPLEHSENLCDQDRSVRLIHDRMPDTGAGYLLHAQAHREIVRQFGRFPARNEALKRASTTSEKAHLASGGYMSTLKSLDMKQAG